MKTRILGFRCGRTLSRALSRSALGVFLGSGVAVDAAPIPITQFTGDKASVHTLSHLPPEYFWLDGCVPTVAGMLFAYWDTYLGKDGLYLGGSATTWVGTAMTGSTPGFYSGTHAMVSSWAHKTANGGKYFSEYGTYDRNGNGYADPADQADWDCLADFLSTDRSGTPKSAIGSGMVAYANWSSPGFKEGFEATFSYSTSWATYKSEIDLGYPVLVVLGSHAMLGFGYYESNDGSGNTVGHVIGWTTWTGAWAGVWGQYDCYSGGNGWDFFTLRIGDLLSAPEGSASLGLLALALSALGLAAPTLPRPTRSA